MPRKLRAKASKSNGCPLKNIDWDIVDSMLESCCTGVEIAARFAVHHDTLYDRCVREKGMAFSLYSQSKQVKTLQKLRDKQIEVANNGNPSLLIWLGKQYLEQRDQPKEETNKQMTEAAIIQLKKSVDTYVNQTLIATPITQTDGVISEISSAN